MLVISYGGLGIVVSMQFGGWNCSLFCLTVNMSYLIIFIKPRFDHCLALSLIYLLTLFSRIFYFFLGLCTSLTFFQSFNYMFLSKTLHTYLALWQTKSCSTFTQWCQYLMSLQKRECRAQKNFASSATSSRKTWCPRLKGREMIRTLQMWPWPVKMDHRFWLIVIR